jgi:hypothetical protein
VSKVAPGTVWGMFERCGTLLDIYDFYAICHFSAPALMQLHLQLLLRKMSGFLMQNVNFFTQNVNFWAHKCLFLPQFGNRFTPNGKNEAENLTISMFYSRYYPEKTSLDPTVVDSNIKKFVICPKSGLITLI